MGSGRTLDHTKDHKVNETGELASIGIFTDSQETLALLQSNIRRWNTPLTCHITLWHRCNTIHMGQHCENILRVLFRANEIVAVAIDGNPAETP